MNHIADMLLTDLRFLIMDLGAGGGKMSPSVYDTAQVLRLATADERDHQVVEWLLEQQQPDGGWGNPAVPRARDLPTLAAILALYSDKRKQVRDAALNGIGFLHRQAHYWVGALPDDLPVGVELLLPRLLEDALKANIDIPCEPYAELFALGRKRQAMIKRITLRAGTAHVHSWEGIDAPTDQDVLDGSGSVGHSPAATAAWLNATQDRPDLAESRWIAQSYLEQAYTVTGSSIPGLYPTVWPMDRFEQVFGLYILLAADLIDHTKLHDVIQMQLADLARALRPEGLGMSDHFMRDGDITATTIAVLGANGYPVDRQVLRQFEVNDHFYTYPGELQPSLTTTAHAIHALAIFGEDTKRAQRYLIDRQLPDGRWLGDKWHSSWLYTTCQVVLALQGQGNRDALQRARRALLTYQHADGGWGLYESTLEETAYALIALRALMRDIDNDGGIRLAIQRAIRLMLARYRPFSQEQMQSWIGKEMYHPARVAYAMQLAALLACVEDFGQPPATIRWERARVALA